MLDWLKSSTDPTNPIPPAVVVERLAIAFLLGAVIAILYRWLRRRDPILPTFPPTLIFLAILIAMVTQVIGDNVARAFSLVGVISIVRFRTVVRDTQDTAFVILSVVVGMAVGADHLLVAVAGLMIIAVAAILIQPRRRDGHWPDENCNLSIRIARGTDSKNVIQEIFTRYIEAWDEVALGSAKQGVALEIDYLVRLRKNTVPLDFITELHNLDGVEKVELRRVSE